jgi:hypothetical protein
MSNVVGEIPVHWGAPPLRTCVAAVLLALTSIHCAPASDHADPIDPLNRQRQEGGITDLFVFPVTRDDRPAHAFSRDGKLPLHDPWANGIRPPLSADHVRDIDALVVILCVRRQLTDSGTLRLEPYTYKLHFDLDSEVQLPNAAMPATAPYATQHGYTNQAPHTHTEQAPHRHAAEIEQASVPMTPTGSTPTGSTPTGSTPTGYSPAAGVSATGHTRISVAEAFLRYGGQVLKPEEINEEVIVELRLDNQAHLQPGYPKATGVGSALWQKLDQFTVPPPAKGQVPAYPQPVDSRAAKKRRCRIEAGVFEDPFIFPAFFNTNVVAMVLRIPIEYFPPDRDEMLVWATSHQGAKQIDHVGRSLRTQNPRFEMLNVLHPRDHVSAILREHNSPGLLRDIFLRLNFAQTFAFRRWDFEPDVLCYSRRLPVGFPNGRLLTDDVAAMLAQHGDTLLYELSYQHNNATWPRQTVNDVNAGQFRNEFPYLNPPFADEPQPPPLRLHFLNQLKLVGIVSLIVLLFVGENYLVARLYHKSKRRRHYL